MHRDDKAGGRWRAVVSLAKAGAHLLLATVVFGVVSMSPVRGGTVSGPFDVVRGWSGGPWDYQYPWAGCGYPSFGFGAPYTWDQPFGFGKAGPYIWGAPFASPSLYLPEALGAGEQPQQPAPAPGVGPQFPVSTVPPAPAHEAGEAPASR